MAKRARSDKEKLQKRAKILKTAWLLYNKSGGVLPTASEIADKALLSKGTIYLYFHTKEEIYLQLYVEKVKEWFDSFTESLEAAEGPLTVQDFVAMTTAYIIENPRVLNLCNIVDGVLEQNTLDEVIIEVKVQLAQILESCSDIITKVFPGISRQRAIKLMLEIYSLVNGLWHFASIPPKTLKALKKKGIDMFDVDFRTAAVESVSALIKGSIGL